MTISVLHQPKLSMEVKLSIEVENIHLLIDAALDRIDEAGFDDEEAAMARMAVFDDHTGATALRWLVEPVAWMAEIPGTRVTQLQDAAFRKTA